MAYEFTHYHDTPWVSESRSANLSDCAETIRDRVAAGTTALTEGELLFDALMSQADALAVKSDPGPGHERADWAAHWRNVRRGLDSKRFSMRFHADGGIAAGMEDAWKTERRLMLGAMEWAVHEGVTRIAKTSGFPVFTAASRADRVNPEGCALSWDRSIAVRQMQAAGLVW